MKLNKKRFLAWCIALVTMETSRKLRVVNKVSEIIRSNKLLEGSLRVKYYGDRGENQFDQLYYEKQRLCNNVDIHCK